MTGDGGGDGSQDQHRGLDLSWRRTRTISHTGNVTDRLLAFREEKGGEMVGPGPGPVRLSLVGLALPVVILRK